MIKRWLSEAYSGFPTLTFDCVYARFSYFHLHLILQYIYFLLFILFMLNCCKNRNNETANCLDSLLQVASEGRCTPALFSV